MAKKSASNKYDTRNIKEMILLHANAVFYLIGARGGKDTELAKEITWSALDRMLDANKGSWEEYRELTAISCMLRGIADNLREDELPEAAGESPMYGDEEVPF